ncbi:scarecrow-like transcription factor PAT1 isoform X2 [Cucurbita pepo subsp. pepo]|uniref:scarecrow-like transcription factor PAT1 isoform X2 n=1 Tax=Cucurbita pepo subsp. pepo TaxID=3664 RepID=UPI000C9D59C9|nr:scarecrow-like transcription factor PAT1 isoform X2 [Cucurbita pepo subsp. pepo]
MQASQLHRDSHMSKRLCYQPIQGADTYCFSQLCSSAGNQRAQLNVDDIGDRYCTLESSSGSQGYAAHNSTSNVTFSSNGSTISQQDSRSNPSDQHNSIDYAYGSPVSGSSITDDLSDFRHKLRELESVMLGPDSDVIDSFDSIFQEGTENPEMGTWGQVMDVITKGSLKKILIACAKAVSDNDVLMAQWLMDELRKMVSVCGEPMQRLGAYMLEGLVARLASSGSCIYKSLRCKEPARAELLSYMHILYEGTQWITLIQAFASRPGRPPHIRITGIDDPASAYARGGGLDIVGRRLSKLAKLYNVPFEFHSAAISGCDVQQKNLSIRRGEALAVNFAFMLHHMPDESVSTENHRDRLLRLVKGLSPKVVTVVEQESNTNTAAFYPRFIETLDYYNAMFESIDVTLPRQHKERINIEQHCLAREVVNILACEGAERVERHELLGKWRLRFAMAGFTAYPLSSLVNATIKTLLDNYSNRYRIEEREGALYLGWMDRDLVASCAWK